MPLRMPQVHPRGGRALVVALLAVLLSGCVGGSAPSQEQVVDEEVRPTASAPAELGPLAEQPRDTREVSGDGFTLFAPASFRQSTRPGPQDVPMLVLGGTAQEPGGVVEVIAFREVDAQSGAREQMAAMAVGKTDLGGVTDLVREDVEWPGTTEAVLVRWSEPTTTAAGAIRQRFAQLTVELQDGALVTVVAVAPDAEFDDAGVLDVLRSLDVGASA